MNENLQDEPYQLGNKQSKVAKCFSEIRRKLEAKRTQKPFSRYLKNRICEIK